MEKRSEWSDKAEQRAGAAFTRAQSLVAGIPMGQPVLVGHHSEKRHRNVLRKSDDAMRRGCEQSDLSKYHANKAHGLESMLARSIFDDDPDAIEQLRAKVEALTIERDRMKLVNKLFRAKDAEGLAAIGLDFAKLKERIASINLSFVKVPYEGYQLTNIGKTIRTAEQRIAGIERRRARTEQATQAGGVVVTMIGDSAQVTFAEKPSREILADLKAASYWWNKGTWIGPRFRLPASVQAMVTPPQEPTNG